VTISNLKYHGTDCGFRIKSSVARKGYIKNILVDGLEMVNVKYPFHLFLNWNPAYSICELPGDYTGEIPRHWRKLLNPVAGEVPNTKVSDIVIRNVKAYNEPDYQGISRAFHIEGFADQPISRLTFEDVSLSCKEFGVINHTGDVAFIRTEVSVSGAHDRQNDEYDNR